MFTAFQMRRRDFGVWQVLMLNLLPTVDYILLYNALAFGLQPVVGLLLDTFTCRAAAIHQGAASNHIRAEDM